MPSGTIVAGDEVLSRQLEDRAFREEWDRTAFAREVAVRVVTYRAEHGLSQSALAKILGMAQPGVARLESGDHTPTIETLRRLSRALGTDLTIDVGPGRSQLLEKTDGDRVGRTSVRKLKSTVRVTRIIVRCDLEDGDVNAAESLSFTYGGKTYTLDLCEKHLDEVKGALEGFANAAHSAGRGRRGRRRGTTTDRSVRTSRPASAPRGESQAEIREWARAQGYAVGDRGRIPVEVRSAYDAARSNSTTRV